MTNCCSPCPTTQTVNIPGPAGAAGTNGSDGADGNNAYTFTTANFTMPANVGGTVTVSVLNARWMPYQGVITINDLSQGVATFKVTAFPDQTNWLSITLQWLQYPNDVAGGTTFATGATVSPSAPLNALTSYSAYATGTSYQLTASSAKVVFGTTNPEATITAAGTYLLFARARVDYNAVTKASAPPTITLHLEQTVVGGGHTSGATNLPNATAAFITQAVTAVSDTAMCISLPVVQYTAVAGDKIALYGLTSALATSGTYDVVEASVVALRIA